MATDPAATPSLRGRDRGRTEAAILGAARDVLAEAGFQGFGVNAVARRAGCDKQLIYRYFGGLEGLVAAIGAELGSWLSDRLASDAASPSSYRALVEKLILGFFDALRGDLLVQKIVAWEIADPSPLAMTLVTARGEAIGAWFAAARGGLVAPAGVDAAAVNAMLIAAVQQVVLSASASGGFAGVALASDADWDRARRALLALIEGVYGPGR